MATNAFSEIGDTLFRYGVADYGRRQVEQREQARQAADLEAERNDMQSVIGGLAGVPGEQQGQVFLRELMARRPRLAERFGGQYATMLQEHANQVEARRKVAQHNIDMGRILDAYEGLPEAERPAFLAREAARLGPEMAQQMFTFSHTMQQQQGKTQAEQASRDLSTQGFNQSVQLENLRHSNSQRAAAAAAARAAAGAGGPAPSFGVSPNQQVIRNEFGQEEIVYPRGSKEHTDATRNVFATKNAIAQIAELRDLVYGNKEKGIPAAGTETFNTNVGTRMTNLLGDIKANVAIGRGMGVMQEGERKALDEQIPDPTQRGFSGIFGNTAGLAGALDTLEREAKKRHQVNTQLYRHWPGLREAIQAPEGFTLIEPGQARPAARPAGGAATWAGGAPNPAAKIGR
jgi:hypothetical protein